MPPAPSGDRNLLFGILAVQLDFVTRDAFINAMSAWLLDKSKGLLGKDLASSSCHSAWPG